MPKIKNLLDKNKLILYLLIIVIAFAVFALINDEPRVSIKPLNQKTMTETVKMVKENQELRERLARIEPASPVKIMTADKPSQSVETFPLLTVIAEGKSVPFEVNYEDQSWVRPDYQPYWHSKTGQWGRIPDLVHNSYHNLFVTLGAEGLWNETIHESGIAELNGKIKLSVYDDNPENTVAVLAFRHQITDVITLSNQVILLGTPSRTGLQVLSINRHDLIDSISGELIANNDRQKYLFQLVTPDGYETDYINALINFD